LKKLRILVADDHAIVRSGLRLLNAQPGLEVVGEAADSGDAVQNILAMKPDVVVLDLSMPNGGGLGVLRQLRGHSPQIAVVVLTMHEDVAYLRTMLAAGASGYVLKKSADADLVLAIRAAAAGRMFIDPNLCGVLASSFLAGTATKPACNSIPANRPRADDIGTAWNVGVGLSFSASGAKGKGPVPVPAPKKQGQQPRQHNILMSR